MEQNYVDEEYCNNLNDNKKSYFGDQFESTLVKGEYDWTDEKGQKGKYNISYANAMHLNFDNFLNKRNSRIVLE